LHLLNPTDGVRPPQIPPAIQAGWPDFPGLRFSSRFNVQNPAAIASPRRQWINLIQVLKFHPVRLFLSKRAQPGYWFWESQR
jgi:hypothetical protein